MALIPTTITDALVNVFLYTYHRGNTPTGELLFSDTTAGLATAANAANAWANAYRLYAEQAQCLGVFALPTEYDRAEAFLAGRLTTAFNTPVTVTAMVSKLTVAFTLFWMGEGPTPPGHTPISFPVGLVTAVTGIATLSSALLTLWDRPSDQWVIDNVTNATIVATALDVFTRTVQVTTGGGPVFII